MHLQFPSLLLQLHEHSSQKLMYHASLATACQEQERLEQEKEKLGGILVPLSLYIYTDTHTHRYVYTEAMPAACL